MKTYSRVYAKIDLDAIAYNMEQMKQNIRPETKVMAVIKADGYGHGAVQIAEMMERWNYIWGFAVATLDEAVVLRTEGIQKPILVLGCVFPDQYMEMLKHEIRMNIYTEEMESQSLEWRQERGKQLICTSNWIPECRGWDLESMNNQQRQSSESARCQMSIWKGFLHILPKQMRKIKALQKNRYRNLYG